MGGLTDLTVFLHDYRKGLTKGPSDGARPTRLISLLQVEMVLAFDLKIV